MVEHSDMPQWGLLTKGMKVVGESGLTYKLTRPLVQRATATPHVWAAVNTTDETILYIIKQPASGTEWNIRSFRKEIQLHKTFNDCSFIRRQVDLIPPQLNSDPPRMVLEPFENTLWGARNIRRFTRKEIKRIMKSTLFALYNVHKQGLVYTGKPISTGPLPVITVIDRSENGKYVN